MSSHKGGLLETQQAFNFTRTGSLDSRRNSINPQAFTAVRENIMYRTTYGSFHSKDSEKPNAKHIPGYGGYVPNVKAENLFAKTMGVISRDVLTNTKLRENTRGLSSSGFNISKDDFIDKSLNASSRMYGKTCIQRAHPGWNADGWVTTARDSFRNPVKSMRDSHYNSLSEPKKTKAFYASGFGKNHQLHNGEGWIPEKHLHSARTGTQYRDRFNPEMEFHRQVNKPKLRKLPKKQTVYEYNR